MKPTREECLSVTVPRKEQERIEEMWRSSARAYREDRMREVCVEWIQHPQHLCDVFRSHSDYHAREQERYQRILAEESEDAE
jgi:hypothetical protein